MGAGLVTFVQRSDGALRLNVHLHTLALDGVYVRNADGKLGFHALPPPTTAEVHAVAKRMPTLREAALSDSARSMGCAATRTNRRRRLQSAWMRRRKM